MATARATVPHLRLASVDGLPIKGRRPRRRFAASDLSCRIFAARKLASSLSKTCEGTELVLKALYNAILDGDLIVVRALGRDAMIEMAGTANEARRLAAILGDGEA